jgi:conjugative relaxase-like TrwC/TraI family protein
MTATTTLIDSAANAQSYFDADDYYMRDKAPKQWFGEGAELLGLPAGSVIDPAVFGALLCGELPDGSTVHRGGGDHRPGVDLTFSSPKPFTVAALVYGDDRLVSVHQEAVAVALEALQRHAACRMTVDKTTAKHETGNLVVARVMHSLARSVDGQIDPQLHEHAVIMNLTWNSETGKWQALSNEFLFEMQKYAGAVYHSEMARRARELGYTPTGFAANGIFDLAEISPELCEDMSQRTRVQADEWLKAHGLTRETATPAQLDAAMKHHREAKNRDVDHAALIEEWKSRALELGVDLKIPEHGAPTEEASRRIAAAIALHESMQHNLTRTSLIGEHQLIIDALRFAEGHTSLSDVEAALGEVGFVVGEYQGKPQYTTKEAVAREEAMLSRVRAGQGALAAMYSPEAAADRLNRDDDAAKLAAYQRALSEGNTPEEAELESVKAGLNDGQRRAALALLSSNDQIVAINGVAGAGKTFMLSRVQQHAKAAGIEIIALAPSHQAKNEIMAVADTGDTLKKFLLDYKLHDTLSKQHLLVLDEASMVSTEDMAKLIRISSERGCRVALIGDRRQHPAIEAGSPFLQIQRTLGEGPVIEMNESVRHKSPALAAAMAHANKGATLEALATLMTDSENGSSIEVEADPQARYERIADLYMQDREQGLSTVALSNTNRARAQINHAIRERLGLAGTGERFCVQESKDASNVELRKLGSYKPGDVLLFYRENDDLHVDRGGRLTVKQVETDHLVVVNDEGFERVFYPSRLPSKSREYGFDLTTLTPNVEFAAGDEIRFRVTDKDAGYLNGDSGKVLAVGEEGITVKSKGQVYQLPSGPMVPITHEYCLTSNMAQGATRDACVPDFDTSSGMLHQNSFIVMATRARWRVRGVADDFERLPRAIQHSIQKVNALDLQDHRQTLDLRAVELPQIDLPEAPVAVPARTPVQPDPTAPQPSVRPTPAPEIAETQVGDELPTALPEVAPHRDGGQHLEM